MNLLAAVVAVLYVVLLLGLIWHWGYPHPPVDKRGLPIMSPYICPRPVKIWGFIPTPWICTATCKLVNGDTLRCPDCGLERQFPGLKRARRLQ
jgi:hypothetical protein